jgi:hypothetical protein
MEKEFITWIIGTTPPNHREATAGRAAEHYIDLSGGEASL